MYRLKGNFPPGPYVAVQHTSDSDSTHLVSLAFTLSHLYARDVVQEDVQAGGEVNRLHAWRVARRASYERAGRQIPAFRNTNRRTSKAVGLSSIKRRTLGGRPGTNIIQFAAPTRFRSGSTARSSLAGSKARKDGAFCGGLAR